MPKNTVKLSFVIPAHNEEGTIKPCLESIFREIAGKNYATEIIVVNNASTDRTGEVARSVPGVIVVDEPEKGLVKARAAGFKKSTGDLIANVDADTMLPSGWVDKVFREFSACSRLVCLSGPYIYYDLSWFTRILVKIFYTIGLFFSGMNRLAFGSGAMVQGGNFVCRRWALEKIGGFDTSIEFYGEDTDIARRLSKIGDVKWTFKFPMYTSGRRLRKEGVLKTGGRYALNFFWVTIFKRPFTITSTDVRLKKTK
ncbi:MAG: glycosyl transferase family 2 [Candidatus Liptonbacteria bacterium GWB1_49_6]|uniref:Glycosyl transferase family 2 n=1 Tax=Candidatus Liptonbacteria bacterium GWB1_49_6 TaxID=1798644 RepID=A0A1G2C5L7_9BACT|nr:MAG: glycosyl transferase family 2 [Candidatus Liptonbacteria bacterium GWB1_49_6]